MAAREPRAVIGAELFELAECVTTTPFEVVTVKPPVDVADELLLPEELLEL